MLRKVSIGLALVWLAALGGAQAHAHFIWLDLTSAAGDGQQAQLYFSEEPAPGEPHLVGKVAHTKVWLRGATGDVQELKLGAAADDEVAALVAPCPTTSAASLEGTCDYGVYERGPAGLLLQYYAKRLSGEWAKHPQLARAKKLKFDIVPGLSPGKLTLDVLYEGKPPADNSELVAIDPAGEQHELQTDAGGRAEIKSSPGRWAIRAGHIRPDQAGTRDGKDYKQTWHYCTLVLDVPSSDAKTAEELSAADALVRARDGRAIWNDFPGFTADVTLHGNGQEATGKLTIDADGGVTLTAPESPLADWAEEQLYSLVQHRMPDGEVSTGDVTYADDEVDHPLGRKINLGDPDLDSAYRLKDDVIMEVNRSMGKSRFTISVLEIERNAEDKYLPRSFAMNFFDSATGELQASLAYRNDWQRVGNFDVPKRILEIDAHKGGSSTKEIVFANCQLLEKK